MWTLTTILAIALLANSLDHTSFDTNQHFLNKDCKTAIDSLTKKNIYTTVEKEAVNEGGKIALLQLFSGITLDSIPNDSDTKFIIAFIVESDGQVTGERIIKDKTGNIGQKMIKIAKSLQWMPAECNGRKVPTLVELPLQICLQEN